MVDRDEIYQTFTRWFIADESESVEVMSNGVVYVYSSVDFRIGDGFPNGELPLQFGVIKGDFSVSYSGLTGLKGMPREVTGAVVLSGNPLKNLIGCTQKIGRHLRLRHMSQLTSLEGFPTELKGHVSLDWKPTLPLLRTLLAGEGIALWPNEKKIWQIEKILNQYQGQGRAGAIDCKRALVEAGFEGNARW